MGDLKTPLQIQFQITKHLNLAFFDLKNSKKLWVFQIWGFEGGLGPPMRGGPQKFHRSSNFKSPTSKFSLLKYKKLKKIVGVSDLGL
jgi:hypothetical protein